MGTGVLKEVKHRPQCLRCHLRDKETEERVGCENLGPLRTYCRVVFCSNHNQRPTAQQADDEEMQTLGGLQS